MIQALCSETNNYSSVNSDIITVNVKKRNQESITFSTLDKLFINKSIKLSIIGGSIESPIIFKLSNNFGYVKNRDG